MKERIFKAKRKNWKELQKYEWWVEGAIFEGKINSYIITNVSVTEWENDSEMGADVIGYLVDPETICEPTGMTDKNKKKIFEGDIVKHYNDTSHPYSFVIGIVKWNPDKCKFVKQNANGDEWEIHSNCIYEIIGNIFDNPELIQN